VLNPTVQKLDYYSLSTMLVANAIPLFGVVWADWDAAAVVVLYIIETIIIGFFHAGRLLLIGNRGMPQEKTKTNTLALTLFFLFHYNFFIFVQSVLLFGLFQGNNLGITNGFNLVHNFGLFLKEPYLISVFAFIGGQLVYTGRELFVTHSYEKMGADRYMFLPYTRIFIQQFVVIIGAFFMIATNSPTTIVVLLIIFKTTAEYLGQRYGDGWLQPKTN
jgi:hypothetical protein